MSKSVVRLAFILLLALGNSSLSRAKVAGRLELTLEPAPGDSAAVCALAAPCFVVWQAKVSNTTSRAVEITSLRIHNDTLPLSRREREREIVLDPVALEPGSTVVLSMPVRLHLHARYLLTAVAKTPTNRLVKATVRWPADQPGQALHPGPSVEMNAWAAAQCWRCKPASPAFSCVCETPDRDKECHDGRDCSGVCLFKERRLTGPAMKKLPQRAPRDATYRAVGTCSAEQAPAGCVRVILRGASADAPSDIDMANVQCSP